LHIKSKISELEQSRVRLQESTNNTRDMVSLRQTDYDNLVRKCDTDHKAQVDALKNWSQGLQAHSKKAGKNPWKLSESLESFTDP